MAFNILPTGMSFQRLGQFPLDSSAIHNTLADAKDYALNNPTAYPGQILYVADARSEEEIAANVEPSESLYMVTASGELKLVVSKKDLDMNEMVEEVENKVAELQGNLDGAVGEINNAMDEMQKIADEVHADLDEAMQKQAEENQAKLEEMQKVADEVHAELNENREQLKQDLQEQIAEEHQAMKEEADAKYAEIEQAMADMQADADAKHEEIQKAAEDKHAEMEAKIEADHKAMKEEADAKHAEMEQAMADFKAEAEAKHVEMEEEAKAKHEEMKAEADAEHKAVRELVDIEEPYLADVAAYPTSKFLFACGNPITVEPNKGHKFDAEKPEDAVAFVYRWAEGFKSIVVEKEEAAKVYVVGGHGINKVNIKRPIPQTNILVKDVKIKGVVGGSYFEGMVGHANIELNNAELASVIGAGWCGASLNGQVARMNIVDDIHIVAKDSKVSSTLYGGAQGNGVADDVKIELNNCQVGWLTAGGANGMTRNAEVVMNGGTVTVAQSTNRGIVYKARFVLNDGTVNSLYFGGETEDTTVNGIIEEAFVELNGGKVKEFNFGTNNGVEMKAEDIKGSLRECVVDAGDVSMLEQFAHMFFGGDVKSAPVVNEDEIKALVGKTRVDSKEAAFVVPAGSQRVVVAVPENVEVKEIQYMGQGCVDYKDMFEEEAIGDFKVFTYIFAVPCSAKMTFKVIL